MFGTNWKDVLSKRSSDQPADNQQEAGSIILNKREIKQIDYHPGIISTFLSVDILFVVCVLCLFEEKYKNRHS